MTAINGTDVLMYCDGVVIAAQRGLSVNVDVDLPDATHKQSGGWGNHIKGQRNATVDLDALFFSTGQSAKALLDYIINRSDILMVITGGTSYPLIGHVNIASSKIDAPSEGAMSLSGSFVLNGGLYQLYDTSAQMMTDPDGNGTDYDTFTVSGTAVTSAINAASTAHADSNTLNVTDGDEIKLAVFLTLNSGEAPSVGIWDNTSAYISNEEQLSEGLNLITLTATATDSSASLRISNTAAANFELSSIYLFKV